MQPPADGRADTDVPGLANQSKKCGLKGVVRVRGAAEDPPASAEDHWPMTPDEELERGLVALIDPPGDHIRVRHAGMGIAAGGTADTRDEVGQRTGSHSASSYKDEPGNEPNLRFFYGIRRTGSSAPARQPRRSPDSPRTRRA